MCFKPEKQHSFHANLGGGRGWEVGAGKCLSLRSYFSKLLCILFEIFYRRRALSCVAKTPVELFFLGLLCVFTSSVCVHVQEVVGGAGGCAGGCEVMWGLEGGSVRRNLHNQARYQRFLQSHQRYTTTRCKVQNKCAHTQ